MDIIPIRGSLKKNEIKKNMSFDIFRLIMGKGVTSSFFMEDKIWDFDYFRNRASKHSLEGDKPENFNHSFVTNETSILTVNIFLNSIVKLKIMKICKFL